MPLVTSRIAYALHCFPVYNCHICHVGSSPAVIAATPGILTVMLMCSLAPCFPVTSDCWSWKLCHGMCSLVADACLCLWYNSQLFIVMGIAPLPSGIRSHLLSLINSPDNSLQSGCRVSGSPCEMQLLFFLPAGDIMNVRLAAATAVSLLLLALLPIYAYCVFYMERITYRNVHIMLSSPCSCALLSFTRLSASFLEVPIC